MNITYYMAQRYLRSKSSSNAINIITRIAGVGVFVASAALFIVLSGFSGLRDFSLQFTSFVDPDLKVLPAHGKQFEPSQDQLANLLKIEGVSNISSILEERMVITFGDKKTIVNFKGVDDSYPSSTVDSILSLGQWIAPNTNQVVLGWGVARNLSFSLNDFITPLELYAPKPGKGQFASIQSALKRTAGNGVGVFQINENYDNGFVFGNINTARYLLGKSDQSVSAIEILLAPETDVDLVSAKASEVFDFPVVVKNRFQLNDALYKMLNTEQLAVYLIFTLVLIIAIFNVIGALIMIILDKKNNLKTLYNLGFTPSQIKKIFFLHGSLMSLFSGGLGLIFGLILVLLQRQFEWAML
ncbi:MAG: ABC transporter permease, partial [Flavobacteriaceae bacterium]|nr:ABC transporter permease [Flavobacteriaceae bacterium]